MKQAAKILSLEIAKILETYSESEIGEAVDALRAFGKGKALLEYLSELGPHSDSRGRTSLKPTNALGKLAENSTSRAVLRLKNSQPDKYFLLSQFDQLIRSGKVLSTNEALRRFGERLSKDFVPRKSWKESISAVMEVLAGSSLEEIREWIAPVWLDSERGGDDGYQNLANFLIKGKTTE
jgi:hypothetical protein